jgi:hypothetical protein
MLWSPKCTFFFYKSLHQKFCIVSWLSHACHIPGCEIPQSPGSLFLLGPHAVPRFFSYFHQNFGLFKTAGMGLLRTGVFGVRIPTGAKVLFSLLQNVQTSSVVPSAHLLMRTDGKAAGA